ncbi:MAG: nucleotidyltransferase domain-containing protein [Opitutaceae bacterium]|jgi:predicted nucleotidyltransferase|nr:nucleotidyltransferase domain-containing protein [Opitutaceae bacterium]
MNPLIAKYRTGLEALSRRFRVRRLAVFGSAARADFDPARSDVDFLVEFEDPLVPGYADRYLDFALEAERLLGREIDLVTTRSVSNPVFQREIERDMEEIYAA